MEATVKIADTAKISVFHLFMLLLLRFFTIFSPGADNFAQSAPVFALLTDYFSAWCPVVLLFSKKAVVGRFPEIHDAAVGLFPDHGSYQNRKYPFPQCRGKNRSKHLPPV